MKAYFKNFMHRSPQQEEFLQLIQANKGIIFKICHSYCTNKSDREDLAQEIIYQLWKSYKSFDPGFKFSTWMYRVALNTAISFYRKEKSAATTIPLAEHIIEVRDDDESRQEMEENMSLLQQFIHGFKKLDRALMILYLDNKSHREIADILGITETNVGTKISRIKDRLKQKFSTIKN